MALDNKDQNKSEIKAEFKTLLSKQEYDKLFELFSNEHSDTQTNYYFDTPRFTLSANEVNLRVKETDKGYYIICEKRKGYDYKKYNESISKEEFQSIIDTGAVINPIIAAEVNGFISNQKLKNYLSLSTFRISFPYKNGKIAIDKCTYLTTTDYELEYTTKTRDAGKREFIALIKEFDITYKKTQVKLRRALEALKEFL